MSKYGNRTVLDENTFEEGLKVRHFVGGGIILLSLLVFFMFIGWMSYGNDFFLYKFFAPRQEAVRRQVFEQSRAYNEGVVQNLQSYMMNYNNAETQQQKDGLRAIILHETSTYDADQLPPHLATFLRQMRAEALTAH